MCDSIEFKSKLVNVSNFILNDERGLITENEDYANRIKYIEQKREKSEKKAIEQITRIDWINLNLTERQNKFDSVIAPFVSDFQDELCKIYFELGMRCGVIFFKDLTTNEKQYREPTEEHEEPDPPKIEDIISKNPEHITYDEYMILPSWGNEQIDKFKSKIPKEKKDFFGRILTLKLNYELEFDKHHTKLLKVIEPKITYDKNSYPEEIKKKKIDINYLIFHRESTKEWCDLNDIEFVENEDLKG